MKKLYLLSREVLLAWFFVLGTSAVQAATVYRYTGNNFEQIQGTLYDTSMSVNGSFTTEAPLTDFNGDASSLITQFSYFDGVNTLTGMNAGVFLRLTTDNLGNITDWFIDINNSDQITAGDPYFSISSSDSFDVGITGECGLADSSGCGVFIIDQQGLVGGNPGGWNVVPIPPVIYLFGSGLVGLVAMARRRTQS